MHNPRTISDVARKALKNMLADGVEPNPENYQRYFGQAIGINALRAGDFITRADCEAQCQEKIAGPTWALSGIVNQLLTTTKSLESTLHEGDEKMDEAITAIQSLDVTTISADAAAALIQSASQQIAVAIESAKRTVEQYRSHILEMQAELEKTAELVRIDHLTGAINPRGLQEILDRECAISIRSGTRLSFCLIDLDNFRGVNNEYGHASGDQVLQHFSACVKKSIRPSDALIRTGGEEFLLLFPGANVEGAIYVVDRIRRLFQQPIQVSQKSSVQPTFSAGFAELQADEVGRSAMDRADQALLVAKRQGKNRNVTWTPAIQAS